MRTTADDRRVITGALVYHRGHHCMDEVTRWQFALAMTEPIIWLVMMRIACGLWFLASGLRKATPDGISRLIPEEMRRYTKTAPTFYRTFLEAVAIPRARLFAVLVVAGEIGVGAGLAAGLITPVCAAVGVFLNVNYLLATGAGNHAEQAQNSAMILMQLAVIATGAGRVAGLDGLLFAP